MPGPFVAVRAARRLAPLAMMAYQRWQALSPEEKERYRERAKVYTERGRDVARRAQERRRRRRGR